MSKLNVGGKFLDTYEQILLGDVVSEKGTPGLLRYYKRDALYEKRNVLSFSTVIGTRKPKISQLQSWIIMEPYEKWGNLLKGN